MNKIKHSILAFALVMALVLTACTDDIDNTDTENTKAEISSSSGTEIETQIAIEVITDPDYHPETEAITSSDKKDENTITNKPAETEKTTATASETKPTAATTTKPAETTAKPRDPYKDRAYDISVNFIKDIRSSDADKIAEMLNSSPETIKFIEELKLQDVKLSNAQPLDVPKGLKGTFYSVTVEMNVTNNTNIHFINSTGRGIWTMIVDISNGGKVMALFQGENNLYAFNEHSTPEEIAYNFTSTYGVFRTINDFDDLNDGSVDFYRNSYSLINKFGSRPSKPQYFDESLSRIIDFDKLDTANSKAYKVNGEELFKPNPKKEYYARVTSHTIDGENGKHYIIIEYYADSAYLLPAKRMMYTVSDTSTGFKLTSAELVYDPGYAPAFYY